MGNMRVAAVAVLVGALLTGLTAPARANSGGHAPTFGDRGLVELDLAAGIDTPGPALALADGTVVVATSGLVDGEPTVAVRAGARVTFLPIDGEPQDLGAGPGGTIVVAIIGAAGSTLARLRADGSLDPAFGTGGLLVTLNDQSITMAVDAAGLVTVAARSPLPDGVEVRRYLADGTPDPAFHVVKLAWGDPVVNDIVLLADGSIAVGGAQLSRLNHDGTVDATTGVGGPGPILAMAQHAASGFVYVVSATQLRRVGTTGALVELTGGDAFADIAIAGDRIHAAGTTGDAALLHVVVAPDGTPITGVQRLDPIAFQYEHGTAVVTTPTGVAIAGAAAGDSLVVAADPFGLLISHTLINLADSSVDELGEHLVDAQLRTVVAGRAIEASVAVVARLHPDGSLDPTFGDGGRVRLPAAIVAPPVLAQDSAGGYLIAAPFGPEGIVVTRLLANGAVDPAFGTDGTVFLSAADLGDPLDPSEIGGTWAIDLAAAPATTAILATTRHVAGREVGTRLLRLLPGGSVDAAFHVDTDLVDADGLRVFPDGRIAIAGTESDGVASLAAPFLLRRFLATGVPDPTYGTGGTVRVDEGSGPGPLGPQPLDYLLPSTASFAADGGAAIGRGFRVGRFGPGGALLAQTGPKLTAFTAIDAQLGGTVLSIESDGRLLRYDATLTVDPTFGVDGVVPVGGAAALAVGADGSITTAATLDPDGGFPIRPDDIGIMRLLGADPTSFPEVRLLDAGTVTADPATSATLRFPIRLSRAYPEDLVLAIRVTVRDQVRAAFVAIPAGATEAQLAVDFGPDEPVGTATVNATVAAVGADVWGVGLADPALVVRRVATGTLVVPPDDDDPPPSAPLVVRLAGADRIATSILVSQAMRPTPAEVGGVAILARSDDAVDALAGTALAGRVGAPILLTPTDHLDPRVATELRRIIGGFGIVYVLGGEGALSRSVSDAVNAMGFFVQRIEGADRFQTSLALTSGLASYFGQPSQLFLTSGRGVADALSAGPAAASVDGGIVLTDGNRLTPEVAQYVHSSVGNGRVAIGGPAAAADPGAQPIVGGDRYATSALVATRFFPNAVIATFANGVTPDPARATAAGFDALSGGALAGRFDAPVLLTDPATLAPSTAQWIVGRGGAVDIAVLFGGTSAISTHVENQIRQLLNL